MRRDSSCAALLLFALPAFPQCESAKCHVGIEAMHVSPAVQLACTDCHGGRADTTDKLAAHVQPRNRALFHTAANPLRTYAALNQESADFVRFINPGDLRVADQTCGNRGCHGAIVAKVRSSLMTHGAFLWGAALYNNGGFPIKRALFGESYSRDGVPQKLTADPPPSAAEMKSKARLPDLWPLPQYEATQPGNTLRVHPSQVGMFQDSVQFNVVTVPGIQNMFFGGSGLFLATLTGPGRVWLQSMSMQHLAHAIQEYLPKPAG